MLYKYHVAIIKENNIITDKFYQRDEKPDNEEFKNLVNQYNADEIVLNTIDDDELNSIIKEKIDLDNL